MNNPLIKETEMLGGKREFSIGGSIDVWKESTRGPWAGKVVTIHLNFYSPEELGQCVQWAIDNGYQPGVGPTQAPQAAGKYLDPIGNAPLCPVHNVPMKPSKKPGTFYCSKRVGGGYCDQKA